MNANGHRALLNRTSNSRGSRPYALLWNGISPPLTLGEESSQEGLPRRAYELWKTSQSVSLEDTVWRSISIANNDGK